MCLLNTWMYEINISYTFKMEAKIILSKKRSSILDLKGLNICIQEEKITMEMYGTQYLKDTMVLFVNWWTWGMGCIWNTISRMCACFLHIHEVVFNLRGDVSSEENKCTEYLRPGHMDGGSCTIRSRKLGG